MFEHRHLPAFSFVFKTKREVVSLKKSNISMTELLAVAREAQGKSYVKGDTMLCEKRFAKGTAYMAEFYIKEENCLLGKKGEYHRRFLTEEEQIDLLSEAESGQIRIVRHAKIRGAELLYSSEHIPKGQER